MNRELEENCYYELIGYTDYYLMREPNDLYWVYSFKNFRKYPYGYKIEPNKDKKHRWYYKISNDAGDYVKITVDKLIEIALDPRARVYFRGQPPRPRRRRTVVVSSSNFDYYETPKIIDRTSRIEDKINKKNFAAPRSSQIVPFTIEEKQKPLFSYLMGK